MINWMDDIDDLSMKWDPAAARPAWVLVSEGRIEITLFHRDHEWVRDALNQVDGTPTAIVISCPT